MGMLSEEVKQKLVVTLFFFNDNKVTIAPANKNNDVGAEYSVLLHILHPRKKISEAFTNATVPYCL